MVLINKPNESGNWVWIVYWNCGCCIRQCGVAYVYHNDDHDDTNCDDMIIDEVNQLKLSWECNTPDVPYEDIVNWLKIE